MPPKKKFTREEIIQAAFEMARENGIDSVVARELGKRLGVSSSPIFTAFKNMEEVQQEVRKIAMKEFESYVSDALNYTPAYKYVGMRMIEFAMQEPKLFQLLYMQEHDESQTFAKLVESLGDTVEVCIEIMQRDYQLNRKDSELLFRQNWLHTFSICALAANKVCHFSIEEISEILSVSFQGTLMLIKSGTFHTIPVNKGNTDESVFPAGL
ncbi:MAG: TetR/AcrR family transcriptional regulator [Lachnospiraceae bacterium]|nr:TetR/AcrR family transcriptional regulator [Lachnospiraceae bacterium]MBP3609622.1 TetR/AcrR family transcriptional regulator [Lachnospiraceae bacterium]